MHQLYIFVAFLAVSESLPKPALIPKAEECCTLCNQQPHKGDKALVACNDYLQLPQKSVLSKLMLVLSLADTLERQCEHRVLYVALKDSRRRDSRAVLDHESQFSTLEVAAY